MVPGLESAGLVSPNIWRPVLTMFKPSQTENSIAPSGWRCSNGVLRYCTVRPLGALWRLTVGGYPSLVSTSDGWSYPTPFWRLGVVRTLSPLSWTVRPVEALWRPGVPSPFLTAGCTLPLSDGWVYRTVYQNRQAARGAVTFNREYLIQNVVFFINIFMFQLPI
jgi:hypothetical protein